MKFSAKGRQIIKDSEQIDKENGKSVITLSFPIAEVFDYVTNGEEVAKAIAEVLTKSEMF